MEEGIKSEDHLISAAAFVEGGTQDACDDACSICLEAFFESDPPTVTGCKHEFHLQCILEWCQRSSQCPMCWQSISFKDPTSQELLDGIEQERNTANNPTINSTIFHHPTFGDFELQHLPPASATDAELEERIIQHLAAAAAMGRARHIARREGHRNRASGHFRASGGVSVPSPTRPTSSDDVDPTPTPTLTPTPTPPASLVTVHEEPSTERAALPLVSTVVPAPPHETTSTDRLGPNNQDRAGPSEQHSFSDFKTRVNAISMRYKESITKTTKSWKEKIFSRNTEHSNNKDTAEGSTGGIATLSRMMDHLQHDLSPVSNTSDDTSPLNQHNNTAANNNSATGNENV